MTAPAEMYYLPHLVLRATAGPTAGRAVRLGRAVALIGPRGAVGTAENDGCAKLSWRAGRYFLEPCGAEPPSVNGAPLAGRRVLAPGDVIVVGKSRLRVVLGAGLGEGEPVAPAKKPTLMDRVRNIAFQGAVLAATFATATVVTERLTRALMG